LGTGSIWAVAVLERMAGASKSMFFLNEEMNHSFDSAVYSLAYGYICWHFECIFTVHS
jgi:hypothetical protein